MSFEEQVKSVVDKMTQDDKGVWQLPDDVQVPEEVLYAAKLEKRFRDTQSAFTKTSQKTKELELTNQKLTEHLVNNATLHLTEEQATELQALRVKNLDEWRKKVNDYEKQAQDLLKTKAKEFTTEAQRTLELEQRKTRTKEFEEELGITLTDDLLESKVPSKVLKQLEKGAISFEDFLKEVKGYIKPDKIKGADDKEDTNLPDMAKLAGGSSPGKLDKAVDSAMTYRKEVY